MNVKNNKCLDVTGSRDAEGTAVIVWGRTSNTNQRWRVVYLDKDSGEPTTGYNKEFGMHIGRPFYLVSRLPMRRVAQAQGANNISIMRWAKNRAAQQWFFDGKSKTIRSNYWKNYAMDIQSNGGSSNLRVSSTIKSRWW